MFLIHCLHTITEQKISELSSTIGDYEKGRFEDQASISKLKRKLENHEDISNMVKQQHRLSSPQDDIEGSIDAGENSILEKIRTSSSDEYARYFDSGKNMNCKLLIYLLYFINLVTKIKK